MKFHDLSIKNSIAKFRGGIFNLTTVIINIALLGFNIFNVTRIIMPIYGIERISYYEAELDKEKEFNDKLKSGKYILLYHREMGISIPNFGDKYIYLLGKIKK